MKSKLLPKVMTLPITKQGFVRKRLTECASKQFLNQSEKALKTA